MNAYLLFIIIISLIGIKIFIKDHNQEYISKDNSSRIKGIFILIVFASHIMQYATYKKPMDIIMVKLLKSMGQLMVTMFLFYSGYGVYESIKNKGKDYINDIPKKRILNTFINFDICVLVYFIVYTIINKEFVFTRFLLSLIGWDGYGNSNWYIFCILGLYLITYVSCKIFDKKLLSIWLLTLLFFVFLSLSKQPYWYNTLFCYPLGVTYSYYKDRINITLFNNKKYIIILLIFVLINTILFRFKDYIIIYSILSCTFSLLVVLLSIKIKMSSKILLWFGNNLFWIYMLQRLPMIVFTHFNYNSHSYRFFVLCFIITVLLTLSVKFLKKIKNYCIN